MKLVVAITGASGAVYAHRLLEKLKLFPDIETNVVWSDCGKLVWNQELDNTAYDSAFFRTFDNKDFYAPFASGSAQYDALIICPCSMGTLGRIASGISDTLITRTADVMLKERKKLILAIRETPYNLIHIRNMEKLSLSGGVIVPLSPSFYSKPQTIEEAADTVVDRILSLAGIEHNGFKWGKQ